MGVSDAERWVFDKSISFLDVSGWVLEYLWFKKNRYDKYCPGATLESRIGRFLADQ